VRVCVHVSCARHMHALFASEGEFFFGLHASLSHHSSCMPFRLLNFADCLKAGTTLIKRHAGKPKVVEESFQSLLRPT